MSTNTDEGTTPQPFDPSKPLFQEVTEYRVVFTGGEFAVNIPYVGTVTGINYETDWHEEQEAAVAEVTGAVEGLVSERVSAANATIVADPDNRYSGDWNGSDVTGSYSYDDFNSRYQLVIATSYTTDVEHNGSAAYPFWVESRTSIKEVVPGTSGGGGGGTSSGGGSGGGEGTGGGSEPVDEPKDELTEEDIIDEDALLEDEDVLEEDEDTKAFESYLDEDEGAYGVNTDKVTEGDVILIKDTSYRELGLHFDPTPDLYIEEYTPNQQLQANRELHVVDGSIIRDVNVNTKIRVMRADLKSVDFISQAKVRLLQLATPHVITKGEADA